MHTRHGSRWPRPAQAWTAGGMQAGHTWPASLSSRMAALGRPTSSALSFWCCEYTTYPCAAAPVHHCACSGPGVAEHGVEGGDREKEWRAMANQDRPGRGRGESCERGGQHGCRAAGAPRLQHEASEEDVAVSPPRLAVDHLSDMPLHSCSIGVCGAAANHLQGLTQWQHLGTGARGCTPLRSRPGRGRPPAGAPQPQPPPAAAARSRAAAPACACAGCRFG